MNTTADGGGIRRSEGAADDLLAQARVEAAAQRRRRERWRAERRLEDTTVVGALLGAGDATVTLHLGAAEPARGTVVLVGHDVVELDGPTTSLTVPLAAIAALESDAGLAGDPADRSPITLPEVLEQHLHDGTTMRVALREGATLRGELVGLGESLVLRCSSPERHAVVPLDRLASISRPRR